MRSKVAKRMLANIPEETRIFVNRYAELVVLINQILKEKGYSQKELAEKLDKVPSEIHKWLSGEHNFTLRSIAKLEAELGEPLLVVPKGRRNSDFLKGQSKTIGLHFKQEDRCESPKFLTNKWSADRSKTGVNAG